MLSIEEGERVAKVRRGNLLQQSMQCPLHEFACFCAWGGLLCWCRPMALGLSQHRGTLLEALAFTDPSAPFRLLCCSGRAERRFKDR